ncbi:MAG: hypothetical protein H0V82_13045 [Candidatus Protochlamydia sp.]|nr:hypothetical protein [Candidatus Protochlamydia sp.]
MASRFYFVSPSPFRFTSVKIKQNAKEGDPKARDCFIISFGSSRSMPPDLRFYSSYAT